MPSEMTGRSVARTTRMRFMATRRDFAPPPTLESGSPWALGPPPVVPEPQDQLRRSITAACFILAPSGLRTSKAVTHGGRGRSKTGRYLPDSDRCPWWKLDLVQKLRRFVAE